MRTIHPISPGQPTAHLGLGRVRLHSRDLHGMTYLQILRASTIRAREGQ
jgi:hypothetical protein